MRSLKPKNLLLINGIGSPTKIINELLSNAASDSNIYLSYPLGILTLAGWCCQEFPNFNVKIVDAAMDFHKHLSGPGASPITLDDFIQTSLGQTEFYPDFIGISFSFSNGHKACLEYARHCKEYWPKSILIAGGVHATTFSYHLINNEFIDYVVRGAGDITFVDLLDSLIEGKNPGVIPGVVTGIENLASMAPPLDDLDQIPPYPYDLIDMEYLVVNESTNPVYEKDSRTGVVFMSRGCPFGCTYCAADKVHGRKPRFKSVERMVNEVEYLVKNFAVNTINIMDDLFGADKAYFYEFFRKIDERGLQFRLVIPAGLSVAIFNEDMIDVLAARGLQAVYFPIESGSQYVQNTIIKKRVNLDKAVRLIRHARSKGLFVGINIILGFPGETKELMMETYSFTKNLPVDSVALFAAYPYPATEMTETLLAKKVFTEDELLEIWDSATQGFKQRPFDTDEISGQELAELIYDFNIELNFFSNYAIRTGNYASALLKLDKIIARYPFHIVALSCRAHCYLQMDRQKESIDDMEKIKTLIRQNHESQKLFNKYGDQIQALLHYYGPITD
jgi:anaerobic magnesium-protoporphyrin IX monomethyl ester cyclase